MTLPTPLSLSFRQRKCSSGALCVVLQQQTGDGGGCAASKASKGSLQSHKWNHHNRCCPGFPNQKDDAHQSALLASSSSSSVDALSLS
jgi:hypothetical protein